MATSRPFAYNPGTAIPGTTQIGNLAIGTPTNGFESTGLDWWNGPDEELGYIIAKVTDNQPTPLFSGDLILSTTYKPADIILGNSYKRAYVTNWAYTQSVLGETLINNNDKVMFSLLFTSSNPGLSTNSYVGVGTRSMNWNGSFDGNPGNDNQSIGFKQSGEAWFNNTVIQPGLPSWGSGSRIDVAVNHGNGKIWIRVGGDNWNNNPSADPATNQFGVSLNGLTSFYPVFSPGSGSGGNSYGSMTLYSSPETPVPTGFQFLGGNYIGYVGFLRSDDFSNQSFISLVNNKFGQNFTTVMDATNWLDNNNYFHTYTY